MLTAILAVAVFALAAVARWRYLAGWRDSTAYWQRFVERSRDRAETVQDELWHAHETANTCANELSRGLTDAAVEVNAAEHARDRALDSARRGWKEARLQRELHKAEWNRRMEAEMCLQLEQFEVERLKALMRAVEY